MIANVCVEGTHRLTIHPETNRREDIIGAVSKALNLSPAEFYLTQNGKLIRSDNIDTSASTIHVCMRLAGGKGGFGSMLRAIGAQIEKTTNREACRDLSGRRLRDINEEKRMKEYLEKKAKEEEEGSSKIAKKIERLRSKPKHEFKDDEYFEARSNLLDDVSEALEEGFKNATASSSATTTSGISSVSASNENDGNDVITEAGSGGMKRKNTKTGKKQKKKLKGAQWLDDGLSSDDSSDSNDDSGDDSSGKSDKPESTSAAQKNENQA
ncbi:splicing regulator SDE2 [Sitodiplosis mosellana]|uniref:splicing regulator SDE2 n=1 Tax=Sitodiplosis mosellana TaxID=263140 RepID=UPI002443F36A|nr:splicing regulator SDE2 [Sitodiplosis mosellana]